MPSPETTPSTEHSLSRKEKERITHKLYSLPHWIALVRLFGYNTILLEEAREKLKPMREEFGKELVAVACEELVEIATKEKVPIARLKAHIRRMAFQLLGPEPATIIAPPTVTSPAEPQTESALPRQPERRKSRKLSAASLPQPVAAITAATDNHSAIMLQYQEGKKKYPGMLVLIRVGDVFELFGKDAEIAHSLLGLTLTTRDGTTPMAGFPHHQLEAYLHKLLKEGQRIAVYDQVDEAFAADLIDRQVTRVCTPGTMPKSDALKPEETRRSDEKATSSKKRAVRQPRHFVLKQYETWMKERSLAFVPIEDAKRTRPAVAPYLGSLDFIVLKEEVKLLVTVRPHLQAKHLKAIGELQKVFGPEYQSVRVWPTEGPGDWNWQEHPIDVLDMEHRS